MKRLLLESMAASKEQIICIWSIFSLLWGFAATVFADQRYQIAFFTALLIPSCLSIICVISAAIRLKKRCISIPVRVNGRNGTFYLMQGSYKENMKLALQDPKYMDTTVCFAMGLDASADLSLSTRAGILHSVIELLNSEYHIGLNELQQLINEAKEARYKNNKSKELKFDSALPIDVEVNCSDRKDKIRLLLVVNSKKTKEGQLVSDIELVEVQDARRTILKIFDTCNNLNCETVFLGAIGTNAGKFPYPVVLTEIINAYMNAYFYNMNEAKCPKNVVLSVQEKDMRKQDFSTSKIIAFVHQILRANKEL